MATRRAKTVSLPPALEERVERLAKKHHQSFSELTRAALRLYLDQAERDAALKRAFVYGNRRAKQVGRVSEEEVQGIIDKMRHQQTMALNASTRRR